MWKFHIHTCTSQPSNDITSAYSPLSIDGHMITTNCKAGILGNSRPDGTHKYSYLCHMWSHEWAVWPWTIYGNNLCFNLLHGKTIIVIMASDSSILAIKIDNVLLNHSAVT